MIRQQYQGHLDAVVVGSKRLVGIEVKVETERSEVLP
jgi:hypothetical protein